MVFVLHPLTEGRAQLLYTEQAAVHISSSCKVVAHIYNFMLYYWLMCDTTKQKAIKLVHQNTYLRAA